MSYNTGPDFGDFKEKLKKTKKDKPPSYPVGKDLKIHYSTYPDGCAWLIYDFIYRDNNLGPGQMDRAWRCMKDILGGLHHSGDSLLDRVPKANAQHFETIANHVIEIIEDQVELSMWFHRMTDLSERLLTEYITVLRASTYLPIGTLDNQIVRAIDGIVRQMIKVNKNGGIEKWKKIKDRADQFPGTPKIGNLPPEPTSPAWQNLPTPPTPPPKYGPRTPQQQMINLTDYTHPFSPLNTSVPANPIPGSPTVIPPSADDIKYMNNLLSDTVMTSDPMLPTTPLPTLPPGTVITTTTTTIPPTQPPPPPSAIPPPFPELKDDILFLAANPGLQNKPSSLLYSPSSTSSSSSSSSSKNKKKQPNKNKNPSKKKKKPVTNPKNNLPIKQPPPMPQGGAPSDYSHDGKDLLGKGFNTVDDAKAIRDLILKGKKNVADQKALADEILKKNPGLKKRKKPSIDDEEKYPIDEQKYPLPDLPPIVSPGTLAEQKAIANSLVDQGYNDDKSFHLGEDWEPYPFPSTQPQAPVLPTLPPAPVQQLPPIAPPHIPGAKPMPGALPIPNFNNNIPIQPPIQQPNIPGQIRLSEIKEDRAKLQECLEEKKVIREIVCSNNPAVTAIRQLLGCPPDLSNPVGVPSFIQSVQNNTVQQVQARIENLQGN